MATDNGYLILNAEYIMELLKTALQTASLGVWELDYEAGQFQFTREVIQILGLPEARPYWSVEEMEQVVHPDFREQMRTTLAQSLINGKSFVGEEYRILRADGKPCWVLVSSSHISTQTHQHAKMVGIVQDITMLKMQAIQTEQANTSLSTLVDLIPSPLFYKDQSGLYQFCNEAFCNYLGRTVDEIIGKSVYDVAPKELADRYYAADQELMARKGTQVYEALVPYADGSLHDVQFTKATQTDPDGNVIGLVGIMLDITERKNYERQMQQVDQVKDLMIEISQQIMDMIDEKQMYERLLEGVMGILDHADGACLMTCNSSNPLQCRPSDKLTITAVSGYDRSSIPDFHLPMQECIYWKHTGGRTRSTVIVNNVAEYQEQGIPDHFVPLPDGSYPLSTMIIPIYINGVLKYLFHLDSRRTSVFTATERQLAEYLRQQIPILHKLFDLYHQTLKLSRYDSLTGFMNRRHFETIFEDRLRSAKRQECGLVLVVFDMDWLKKVNDCFGHVAGDEYLLYFAECMKANFRASDAFARIGGDEFTAIFTDADFHTLKDRLLAIRKGYVEHAFAFETGDFKGRFSFGMAQYPEDGSTYQELMRRADERMYADKKKRHPLKKHPPE